MAETGNLTRYYEVTTYADVSEAEVRDVPYSRSGATYRPDHITVVYRWTSENTDQKVDVQLRGSQIRKDGSEGQRKREALWSRDEWPEWVKRFVADNRPAAVPETPVRGGDDALSPTGHHVTGGEGPAAPSSPPVTHGRQP